MVASAKNFVGCIGDVTLNGALINFANVTDRMNGLLGKCYLDKTVTEVYPGKCKIRGPKLLFSKKQKLENNFYFFKLKFYCHCKKTSNEVTKLLGRRIRYESFP